MTMRFSYKQLPAKAPVPSLGGRTVRPRPLLWVTLLTPAAVRLRHCLLDTGSDDTVFPESVAAQLGIDLTNAPIGEASGMGLATATIRYAEVQLRVSDGREFHEWTATVGFTSTPLKQPLLGYAGFLRYFTATFHGDLEEVELAVNSEYPGT
jgi:hypothetical protein